MNKRILIFDVSNCTHRIFHALPNLTHEDIPVSVVYGFLKSVEMLTDRFQPTHCIFAFDMGIQKRLALLPTYKLKRHSAHANAPADEQTARQNLHRQIALLKEEYLPQIGYKNIFSQRGYEADDIIASVTQTLEFGDASTVVSSDSDLWQLIKPGVNVYNPVKQKLEGLIHFKRERGIHPKKWAVVKALAGCATDEIPGIKGVGEKTALKFLKGELTKGKTFEAITSNEGKKLKRFNRSIVQLPFEGVDKFVIQDDVFSVDGWNIVCEKLGMRSLVHSNKQMKFRL